MTVFLRKCTWMIGEDFVPALRRLDRLVFDCFEGQSNNKRIPVNLTFYSRASSLLIPLVGLGFCPQSIFCKTNEYLTPEEHRDGVPEEHRDEVP